MGYYTRVLTKRADCPPFEDLVAMLRSEHPDVVLSVDEEEGGAWTNLVLSHVNGPEIAAIERNAVADEEMAVDEIAEFIEEVESCQPATSVPWLTAFLGDVKVTYAFQHLSGTRQDGGAEALRAVSEFIWARGDAIIQADNEGFSNEAGYHILWQFSDEVSGLWWMAVLLDGKWVSFQMDLGDPEHREAFQQGRVPTGVTTA